MHIAIAVGTMLLGSWVLNSPTDEEETISPEELQPPAEAPSGPSMPYTPPSSRSSRMDRGGEMMKRGGSMQGGQPQRMPRQAAGMGMPMAPTESGAGGGYGQPGAPTSGVSSVGPGAFGARHPRPPTERSSSEMGRPISRNALDQGHGAQPVGNAAMAMVPPVTEKPFMGFRPTSGVSPYMNLFRPGGETVDNYTSLVRPQLDQRFRNQQFDGDIRGLQNNTRMQGVDLRQLYRSNQTLQGVGTPQFYMNYQNYYPNSGQ